MLLRYPGHLHASPCSQKGVWGWYLHLGDAQGTPRSGSAPFLVLSNPKLSLAALTALRRESLRSRPVARCASEKIWSRLATTIKINAGKFKWQRSEGV